MGRFQLRSTSKYLRLSKEWCPNNVWMDCTTVLSTTQYDVIAALLYEVQIKPLEFVETSDLRPISVYCGIWDKYC